MTTRLITSAAMIAVIFAAVFLRFPDLDARPMHGDEAVNAVKFAALWRDGRYVYDPHEFHGPALPYATLPFAWISPAKSFAQTDEAFFRVVSAVAGSLLVVITLFAARGLGFWPAIIAALACAISPAMSFYSRYYIHEMLLVLFSASAIFTAWRYLREPRFAWAIACGVSVGLMHATKETCLLVWIAMIVAGIATHFSKRDPYHPAAWKPAHLGAAVAAAMIVSVTLFSSFFTNMAGPLDSVRTYFSWLSIGSGQVGGGGGEAVHNHPWHWYFDLLIWHHPAAGPWWSEAFIVVLSLAGWVIAFAGWGLSIEHRPRARFVAVYTLMLALMYSAIPYKTPWCLLGFYHGMMVLGGIAAVVIVRKLRMLPLRVIIVLALGAGFGQLAQQAYATNFRFHTDARNPWVYAHPGRDVRRLAERCRQIAALTKEQRDLPIRLYDEGNYWPLPFYLHGFAKVGYFAAAPGEPGELASAPLVIAGPRIDGVLEPVLEMTHHHEFFGLRRGVVLTLYIRKDLWEAFIALQQGGGT
ncbi:MAG: TIGR03663 family protein [Planctomycetes bacterium]|nr:TIGR03663 family protein [Planctomycetota bacterium]